jgi:hypothetical protein
MNVSEEMSKGVLSRGRKKQSNETERKENERLLQKGKQNNQRE